MATAAIGAPIREMSVPGPGRPAHLDSDVVSVVIPTVGRASVAAAVESVLIQTYAHTEVIVVYDGGGEIAVDLPSDPRVRLVKAAGSTGVAAARALGIAMATGKYLALLDDDDTWVPTKLAVQLEMFERLGARGATTVCASRIRVVDQDGRGDFVVPTRLIEPDTPVADYLFSRRRVRWGEAVIHPSTIMCERRLAAGTIWPDLTIHEDWEWLLRLVGDRHAKVIMAEEPLVNVTETPGSASRSTKWRESLAWVMASETLSRRQKADVLLCTTAAYARAARDRRAAAQIAKCALAAGPPGLPACLFFMAFQIASPRMLTRLARALPGSVGPRAT